VASPYIVEVEVKIIVFAVLLFFMASMRLKVATRFSCKWTCGSVSPTCTSGFAAR